MVKRIVSICLMLYASTAAIVGWSQRAEHDWNQRAEHDGSQRAEHDSSQRAEHDRSQRAEHDTLSDRRARWEAMSPEQRALLRERFREFRALDPDVRDEMARRAGLLEQRRQAFAACPPPWVRERLEQAAPGERERLLGALLVDHQRELGCGLRERVPPEMLAKLEGASSLEERMQVLGEWRHHRGPRPDVETIVRRLAGRLELGEAEIQDLLARPEPERQAGVLNLLRRVFETQGRPETVTAEDWERWRQLPDAEFVERVKFLRRSDRWCRNGRERRGGPDEGFDGPPDRHRGFRDEGSRRRPWDGEGVEGDGRPGERPKGGGDDPPR